MFSIFLRQAETPALPELCLKKKLILVGQASVPVQGERAETPALLDFVL